MSQSQAVDLRQLRQHMRQQRRQLTVQQQQQHARQLAANLFRHRKFINSNSIAGYLANDGEIDPMPVMERAWAMGKKVYLPVLSPLQDSLYFAPFTADCRICINRFGIAEPDCHARHWLRAQEIDLLLLPLVAFDPDCNRVGMGGGFYDRSLAFLKRRSHWRRPFLVGLAHELQKADSLVCNHWDVPLNVIATEQKLYITQ